MVAADTDRTLLVVEKARGHLMHHEVLEWVQRWVPAGPTSVLDVGGRDINGQPHYLFEHSTFEIVDLVEAPALLGLATSWTTATNNHSMWACTLRLQNIRLTGRFTSNTSEIF